VFGGILLDGRGTDSQGAARLANSVHVTMNMLRERTCNLYAALFHCGRGDDKERRHVKPGIRQGRKRGCLAADGSAIER
jgi:hypothetical protein